MAIIRDRRDNEIIFETEFDLRQDGHSFSNLSFANLADVDLRYADFSYSDLSNADLSGANLYFTNLRGANLTNAILTGANMQHTMLDGATLDGSVVDENTIGSDEYITPHRQLVIHEVTRTLFGEEVEGFGDSFSEEDHLLNQALTFGVELEFYLPKNKPGAESKKKIIAKLKDMGIDSKEDGFYNHHTRPYWKMVTDGSLEDYEHGLELVSPILMGDDGLKQLAEVCKVLKFIGCKIDKKCGVHVHIGVRDENLDFFKNLFSLYSGYEPLIDTIMPESRRKQNATYCKSNVVSLESIANATTLEELGNVIGNQYDISGGYRYMKLNIQSYWRHGTVEFRQHAGSLDYKKIMNWIKLCMSMVDRSKQGLPANIMTPARSSRVNGNFVNPCRRGTNRHLFVEMLMRPSGVTTAEYNVAIGNASGNLTQCASLIKQLGLSVKSKKKRDWFTNKTSTRYWLNRDQVERNHISHNFTFNKQTFFDIMQFEESTANYINARIAHFA